MPKNKRKRWIRAALIGVLMAATGLIKALNKKRTPYAHRKDVIHLDVMYEARDVDATSIGWVAIGVILSALIIHAVVKLTYGYFSRTQFAEAQPVTMIKEAQRPPTLPQLQTNPAQDLEQLQRADQQVLGTYGWVDRDKGLVRIPIEEAIQRVLEKGLPPAEKAAPSPAQ